MECYLTNLQNFSNFDISISFCGRVNLFYMSSIVQYPYAIDELGKLVYIGSLSKEIRSLHSYFCPYCGSPMVACLGEKNTHYFSHVIRDGCSVESYIHKTAKLILLRRFNDNRLPFKIVLSVQRQCKNYSTCENAGVECQPAPICKEYDLKKYYDLPASLEKSYSINDEKFVPDILLQSTNSLHKPIFIELCYKHKSSNDKLRSGLKIIEIRLRNMDDIRRLEDIKLIESEDVHFYNFNSILLSPDAILDEIKESCIECDLPISDSILPFCKQSAKYKRMSLGLRRFIIYTSGKVYENGIYESELHSHMKNAAVDITYKISQKMIGFDPRYVLAKQFPKFKICQMCTHCISTEYVTWCKLVKNGSTRKGTFNDSKAVYCVYFKWNEDCENKYDLYMHNIVEGEDFIIWVNENSVI